MRSSGSLFKLRLVMGFQKKPVIWYISGHAAIVCSRHSWKFLFTNKRV